MAPPHFTPCLWVPIKNPDPTSAHSYSIWMLPSDFDMNSFIKNGSDPEAYNKLKMASIGSGSTRSSPPSLPSFSPNHNGVEHGLSPPSSPPVFPDTPLPSVNKQPGQAYESSKSFDHRCSSPAVIDAALQANNNNVPMHGSTSIPAIRYFDAAGVPLRYPSFAHRQDGVTGPSGTQEILPSLTSFAQTGSPLARYLAGGNAVPDYGSGSEASSAYYRQPIRQPLFPPRFQEEKTPGTNMEAYNFDRVFRPMHAKTATTQPAAAAKHPQAATSALFPPPQANAYQRMLAGFSPNYRGNIHLDRNRSADIPATENCSLFIIGLPPSVTVTSLLATIRDCGRVYATHVNPPEPGKGHVTCAAKVIFFDRASAERFHDRHALGGLRVAGEPGYAARVVWNRIRTAASTSPRHHSRVLLIAGPEGLVNRGFLMGYFSSKLDYDVDEVLERGSNGGRALIEFRFGSYRCQAESAKMAISRELGESGVQVWFGVDPCDVVDDGLYAGASAGEAWKDGRVAAPRVEVHPSRVAANWRGNGV
jgi:hypothetical protein